MNELLIRCKRLPHLMLISIALLMVSITAVSAAEVYMDPSSSSINCGQETEVKIKVNANDFQGGQVVFTYDPKCVALTDFITNKKDFPTSDVNNKNGMVRIGFLAPAEVNGEFVIATFSIKCISECTCTTDLKIVQEESKLIGIDSKKIPSVCWTGGTFSLIADDQDSDDSTKVYMDPSSSSINCGQETEVKIKVNANDFQGGQVVFTYDPKCVALTGFITNEKDFPTSGVNNKNGMVRIGFLAPAEVNGEFVIATFSIKCISECACSTDLVFDLTESKIMAKTGTKIETVWQNGYFECIEDSDGICLSEGWNFVSIPYVLENQSFEDITEGLPLECIMEYNSKECIWTNPGCEWVPLKGYWIYANKTCCIPDDRLAQKGATAPGNLELYEGWNAIGHSDSTDSLYAKTVLGGIDNSEYRYIMGPWDPVKKTYTQCGYKNQTGMLGVDENDKKHRGTDIFEMSPHEGYWLYMNMTGKYGPVGS